jgi:hypothetical protein
MSLILEAFRKWIEDLDQSSLLAMLKELETANAQRGRYRCGCQSGLFVRTNNTFIDEIQKRLRRH